MSKPERSAAPHRATAAGRWRRAALALAVVLLGALIPAAGAKADVIRFVVDRSQFREVNVNDAEAALNAYTKTLGEKFQVMAELSLMDGQAQIAEAMRRGEFDIVSVPSPWLLEIPPDLVEGPLLVAEVGGRIFEEFVVLVRAADPAQRVADLKGRKVLFSTAVRAELLPIWLEVHFHEQGLGPPESVLGSLTSSSSSAQVILPVFFGKADACVVSRAAWETMGELNPQVRTQLRPIAASPRLLPGGAFFRKGSSPTMKERVHTTVLRSQDYPAYRQILTLFRLSNVSEQPIAILDETRQLLSKRLAMRRGDRRPGGPPARSAGVVRRP